MTENLEALSQNPVFKDLSSTDLKAILESGCPIKVEQGGFFFMQDDPGEHLYLLTDGRARLTQVTHDGHQVILHVIGPGEVFGLVAFVKGGAYPGSVEAVVDCQAISWDQETLLRLAGKYPRLALNAVGWMSGRIHELQDRIRELSTERVERRLARVLLRLVRQVGRKMDEGVLIDLPISRQDLAEMSGTTLFTVSRIISQWERQGIVDGGRERVLIRFPHGLVRIAEDLPPLDRDGEG